jgi:F420-dependent oxidoreductase-like protein
MRIGIHSFVEGTNVEKAVRQVQDAEIDGFDTFWFGQIPSGDALTAAALAGRSTSRIEIGTAVVPTYSRHPFTMASQALTVQTAAGGRFALGVGPSHRPLVEGMWGISYDRAALHVREYLSVLRPLIHECRVAFSGEMYRVSAALQIPDPQPCPILISALAPMMLRTAGELSDGTITWMTGPKTIESHIVPRINAAAEAAGRPRPRIVVPLPFAVTDDATAARERAASAFQFYGLLPNYRRVLDREGATGPQDVAIVGNESQVEAELRALAAIGATDFAAVIFAAGDNHAASFARSRELLKGLVGKL